ncbi:hypothetical protein [uncultured Leifsonia sp.]|uniref:hypothetical protein n=1 Tax=uncultured Leifsonia sp. TaxID=340359 RepID=UPI0028D61775|nr:hypothetical protein [uncultured Leifsonia sp.]
MSGTRLWVIGAVLGMVVIVVLGWIVGVQPQLTSAAVSTAQRLTVDATNARYQAVLAALKADHEKLPQLQAQLSALKASVPPDAESSAFVKELNAIAAAHGVTITGLTFSDAVGYKPPATSPAAPAAAASGTSTSTPAPAPSPSSTPQAPTPETNPLVTPSNFFASPVQVAVSGQLGNVLDFLQGAQKGTRLFLVTALSSNPSTTEGAPAGTVDATIGGYIYSVSTAQAQQTGGTPPASGAAQQPAEASK